MNKYVVGHKNPDTDSFVAAIGLAALLGYVPAAAGEPNKETKLVLEKFGFGVPALISAEEKEVILVDHNEPSQIHENIKEEEIVAIYDHHKLGGLATKMPITMRTEVIGATSTIVAKMYREQGVSLSKEIAGLLLCGIISDTFNLNSPTQTDQDKEVYEWLREQTGLNANELAVDMFNAKSDISDITTSALLSGDYKVFDFSGKKVGIGVWETVLPEKVLERKDEIKTVLEEKKKAEGVSLIYFAVVDILNNKSHLFLLSQEEESVAQKAFGGPVTEGLMELAGIVSRKKEIAPAIEKSV